MNGYLKNIKQLLRNEIMNNKWESIVIWNNLKTRAIHDTEIEARKCVAEVIMLSSVKSVSVREVKPKKKG